MADNKIKKTVDAQYAHEASPLIAKLNNIYKAITITKSSKGIPHIDPTGQGRIAAYIPALNQSPEKPTYFKHAKTGSMFNVPDETGIVILVFFADHASTVDAFWFATSSESVDIVAGGVKGNPHIDGSGIGEGAFEGVAVQKVVLGPEDAEKNGEELPNSPNNKVLGDQGTFSDDLRGPTSASPRRDAAFATPQHSKVTGLKTSAGSSISIDDGSVDDTGELHPEQIRITTSSGASIMLDGGNDFIHIINSSGTGWIEVGASGEVMVYAEGSLNMRTQKDFNLRADKNINLEAGENINIHSFGTTKINTDQELHFRSQGNQFLQSESGMNINVGVNCIVTTGSLLHLNGPLAPISELILTSDMPDIEELECTTLKKTIVSELPTHEPFIRPHSTKLTTSVFAQSKAKGT